MRGLAGYRGMIRAYFKESKIPELSHLAFETVIGRILDRQTSEMWLCQTVVVRERKNITRGNVGTYQCCLHRGIFVRKIDCVAIIGYLPVVSIWYDNDMRRMMLFCLVVFCTGLLGADEGPLSTEPEIVFISPLGGQQGTTQKIEIHGNILDNASAVIFETEGITTHIEKIEAVSECCFAISVEAAKESINFLVRASVEIGSTVPPGNHWLRVVTPRGITNRILFRVNAESVIEETDQPHSTPEQAQPIVYPVVVNGKIDAPGAVDFYQVEVTTACELSLEVRPSHAALRKKFRPEIGIFAKRASFLDPDRVDRLDFADVAEAQGEKVTMNFDPREREGTQISLNYQVTTPGSYFVRVGSLMGHSAPDYVYQFRVALAEQSKPTEVKRDDWQERSLTRKLDGEWIEQIWTRSVRSAIEAASVDEGAVSASSDDVTSTAGQGGAPTSVAAGVIQEIGEMEPNGEFSEALEVPVPGIAHGSIAEPGDIDLFHFKVSDGQKLAFEVETPDATVPFFNPVVEVVDAGGNKKLASLQQTKEFTGDKSPHLIGISAKIIGTFEKGGDFYLRIREVTVRNGAPNFMYRVLIRPQIPHVGKTALETRTLAPFDARIDPFRVNLIAGQARKITLLLNHEEGFFTPSNQIAVSFEGLPEGVELLAGSSPYRGPGSPGEANIIDADTHRPVMKKVVAVLYASADAPVTPLPHWIAVNARPVVDGVPAGKLKMEKIPLMVLSPESAHTDESPK